METGATAEPELLLTRLCRFLLLSSSRTDRPGPAKTPARTPHSDPPLPRAREAVIAGGAAPIAVPGPGCSPRWDPAGGARTKPEGSPGGRFRISADLFLSEGQRYLRKTRPGSCPGLCGKHPQPPQQTWRASFWPARRTLRGRELLLHTAQPLPAPLRAAPSSGGGAGRGPSSGRL